MNQARTALIALVLGVICVSPAIAQTSPWPMFRHDKKHSGRTNFTGPATPAVNWTYTTRDAITASPTIGHNGTIYVGAGGYYRIVNPNKDGNAVQTEGADSTMYAINPDGSLKWEFKTDSGVAVGQSFGIFSSAAIGDDGAIYFGSLDNNMYCVEDSGTYGKLRWKSNPGNWPFYSSPVIGDSGIVYAGCLNFRFYAFNPDGTMRWFYPTGWCVFSSPIIDDDDRIIFGSKDHNLYCFRDSIPYGSMQWQLPIGTFYDGHLIDCSPAMGDNGVIYFGSDPYGAAGQPPTSVDTSFWAANSDGSLRWSFPTGDGVEGTPAIGHDGTIYFGSFDSCVYAIEDSVTYAKLKWKYKTGGPVDAPPTVDGDGTIYIGSRDSVMYAFNPDGTLKWSFATNGGIESSVTVDGDGNILFGSFDHNLYCLGTGAPDVGAVAINLPDEVQATVDYNPAAEMASYRQYDQSADLVCVIEDTGGEVFRDTISVADAPGGGTKTGIFDAWTVGSDSGTVYTVTVWSVLPGDDNVGNDTVSVQVESIPKLPYVCGDIDNSGAGPDIADLVYLVTYMFSGGPPPVYLESSDVDGSGSGPDIADLVYLVTYMFNSGPPPNCG